MTDGCAEVTTTVTITVTNRPPSPTPDAGDCLCTGAATLNVLVGGALGDAIWPGGAVGARCSAIGVDTEEHLSVFDGLLVLDPGGEWSGTWTLAWTPAGAPSVVIGADVLLPVHAGEIQGRSLGMDVRVWDEQGQELEGQVVVAGMAARIVEACQNLRSAGTTIG